MQSPHSHSISKILQLMVTPQASSTRSLLLECNGRPTLKTLKLEQMPWSILAAFSIAEIAKRLRNGSPHRTYRRTQSNGSPEENKVQPNKIQELLLYNFELSFPIDAIMPLRFEKDNASIKRLSCRLHFSNGHALPTFLWDVFVEDFFTLAIYRYEVRPFIIK